MIYTKTYEGPIGYFQISYLIHTLLTVFARLKIPKIDVLRKRFEQIFSKEIIIRNEIGLFSINPKNDSLTKSITSFEYDHQEWLIKEDDKKIFIDIGANIGFYSILSVKKYGYQAAYAFEPNPETYVRLEKNMALNNLTGNIKLSKYGLSDTTESGLLGVKSVHTGASTFVHTEGKDITAVAVKTTTFDAFVEEHAINPHDISFIKIDVEGFEYRVLKGMKNTLAVVQKGTRMFIEIHPRDPGADQKKDFIESIGFTCNKSSFQNNYLYVKK